MISQEIKRGACLIHNTAAIEAAFEPFVLKVEGNKVIYLLPLDEEVHEMSLQEAQDNYLVIDVIEERDIAAFINF